MAASLWAILILCVVTFVLFWADKRQALHGGWRVPEATLIAISAAGGAVGALLAMVVFRHKTFKEPFPRRIPWIIVAQIIIFIIVANIFL